MGIKRIVCGLFIFFIACIPHAQTTESRKNPTRIVLRAARMIDVTRNQIVNHAVVIIEGDKISAAGENLPAPQQVEVIDLGDATLLPGLIDAHTHITYHFDPSGHFGLTNDPNADVTLRYAAENAAATLNAGFTTIRNLGAGDGVDLRLRDAVNRGEKRGPRMLVSGMPLLPNMLPSEEERGARLSFVREFVRARVKEGADVIKVFEGVDETGAPLLSEFEIRAVVEEAAKLGRRVAVHAHEAAAIKAAVRGGCASIEHGTFLDAEAIRLMVQHRTFLVPTLYLPTHYLSHKEQFAFDDSTWDFFERLRSRNLENARQARQAGVTIVSGSDAVAGVHGQNFYELEWLVKAGLTPLEAIHAATADAARLLGIENQTGEIRVGLQADIIALKGDPSRDITALERVSFVLKSGQVIKNDLTKSQAR